MYFPGCLRMRLRSRSVNKLLISGEDNKGDRYRSWGISKYQISVEPPILTRVSAICGCTVFRISCL